MCHKLMGVLFSCFRWRTTHEEDEVLDVGNNQLGRGAIRPKYNKGSMNHQLKAHTPGPQPEPMPASEPEPMHASEPEPMLETEPKPEPMPTTKPEPKPMHASEPEPEPRLEFVPKPELDPILESNGLISRKSNLHDDIISSRDEECPICLEGYTSENPKIITTCSHHFHLGCIYDWQERSALCPTCLKVMEFQEIN